jgi:hypothetical protein
MSAGPLRTGTLRLLAALAVVEVVLAGAIGGSSTAAGTDAAARWTLYQPLAGVLDLTMPGSDGRLRIAAAGQLFTAALTTAPEPLATGDGGYRTDPGPEAYIALSTGAAITGAGCAFERDAVYAIDPGPTPGVIAVDLRGRARRIADLPGVKPNGIAFDDVGRFGHRLLVTATAGTGARVFGIDCAGGVTTIASDAPVIEGGIAVAPLSFGGLGAFGGPGTFGGDLVAPDEQSGRIWAIAPDGTARLVARSPLPRGGDIGPESVAFVPAGFTPQWAAYVADRRSPGNDHPGHDHVLRLTGRDLAAAGVRAGDLVVVNEASAQTVVTRCAATCTSRHLADGPPSAHVEGHVVILPPRS